MTSKRSNTGEAPPERMDEVVEAAVAQPARQRYEVVSQTAHGHRTVHRPAGVTSTEEALQPVAELLPQGSEVVDVRDVLAP